MKISHHTYTNICGLRFGEDKAKEFIVNYLMSLTVSQTSQMICKRLTSLKIPYNYLWKMTGRVNLRE